MTQMELSVYVTLDGTDHAFDGGRARLHLIQRLAMLPSTLDEKPELKPLFEKWLAQHSKSISVHPSGPLFLLPPAWFR